MELKRQGLQSSNGIGLDDDPCSVFLGSPAIPLRGVGSEIRASKNFVAGGTHHGHGVENRTPFLPNGFFCGFNLLCRVGQMQRRACDGRFEIRSDDFDTARCLNTVEIDPTLSSITHLCHSLWALEPLDVGGEGAVLACQHDGVTDIEDATVEDHIDGLPHTDFVPHLQHGSLSGPEGVGQSVLQEPLCQTDGHGKKVLQTLAFLR